MEDRNSSKRPRLVILSDLWGFENCDWIEAYTQALSGHFSVVLRDCRELGQVDRHINSQESIHAQFVGGGIDKAAESLIALEQEKVFILACSVGGTIAWKAIQLGLKAHSLAAVSATRLRHEKEKADCDLALYFGEHDAYRPDLAWAEKIGVEVKVLAGEAHEMYKKPEVIAHISADLISKLPSLDIPI